jgi:hypothetical protein
MMSDVILAMKSVLGNSKGMSERSFEMFARSRRLLSFVAPIIIMASIAEPAAADSSQISSIKVSRTTCEGLCPSYVLTLNSDGCAKLVGKSDFALIGEYSAVGVDFRGAVAAINSHDFFHMRNTYPFFPDGAQLMGAQKSSLTVYRSDKPAVTVTVDGSTDIPVSVTELFRIIDGIGFTAQWINDTTHTPVSSVSYGHIDVDKSTYSPCS